MDRANKFGALCLRFGALLLACTGASALEGLPSKEDPASKDGSASTKEGTPPEVKPLIRIPKEKTSIEKWMKDSDWSSLRDDPKKFEVAGGRLHLVSERDSVMIGTKSGFPIEVKEWPRLRMKLRVDKNPKGMDLSKKSGDDAGFRLYVAFDRGGGLLSPSNTIAYTWTENMAAETCLESPHFKQLRYVSIGAGLTAERKDGKAQAKEAAEKTKQGEEPGWIIVERNLVEDYRRAFPADKKGVPPLTGIVLKCDSNNTETSAEAWVSVLELLPATKD
jgi:hypothetical protein